MVIFIIVLLFMGCKTDRSATNNSVTAVAGVIAEVLVGAKVGIVAGVLLGVSME